MLTIIKIENNEPTGWIVASDVHDARRQIPMGDEWQWLAQELYRMEFTPPPGKHRLSAGFWMLVG